MKPPAFTYHRPTGVGEALEALAAAGPDGKVLAGGQSLVPVLNMRLAAPAHLIDINRLTDLAYVSRDRTAVRVGALTRHADLERSRTAAALPLLGRATRHVAHPAIRNRGTTVGSLVHADPAAELPGVLALVGGEVVLASAGGTRVVPAAEFLVGPLECALRPGELAVEAVFPVPPAHTGSAWTEVSRRHGDYALCGVGALVTLDDDRRIAAARAVCVAVGPVPAVVDVTGALAGRPYDAADWAAAGALVAGAVEPEGDIHASAEYRRHLVAVLTARALRAAAEDATGQAAARDATGQAADATGEGAGA